jgi:hypothetical protein
VAIGEAAWASLLIRADVDGGHGAYVHLPFLAFALPAACVAAGAGLLFPLVGRRRWAQGLFALGVVVAVAVTAGCVAELTVGGSLLLVGTHPWSATGQLETSASGVAWLVAIVAGVRGAWLGAKPPSFRHAVISVGLAGATFVGIFAARAANSGPVFHDRTADAGLLFFLAVPLLAAAVALLRQREVEERVLRRPGSAPGLVWVSVLAVPMVAVTLVALALAATVGPAAPLVGRGLEDSARGLGDVIGDLVRLLPAIHLKPHQIRLRSPAGAAGGRGTIVVTRGGRLPAVVGWILLGLVAAAVAAVVVLLLRRLRPTRRRRPSADLDGQTRDFVFSWAHLAAQLRRALRSWWLGSWWRRNRRQTALAVGPLHLDGGPVDGEILSVRHAYRRLLVEARRLGARRHPAETTQELERRLIADLDVEAAVAVRGLTGLYEAVRYGQAPSGRRDPDDGSDTAAAVGRSETTAAVGQVAVILPALRQALAPPVALPVLSPEATRRRRRRWVRR